MDRCECTEDFLCDVCNDEDAVEDIRSFRDSQSGTMIGLDI